MKVDLLNNRKPIVATHRRQPSVERQIAEEGLQTFRPLRRNFLFAVVGHGVYALSQWAMIAGLAKLGTAEAVGYFALCVALTAPVVELTGLQLHVVQATDARARYALGDYLLLRLATGVLALGIILAVVLLSTRPTWLVVTALALGLAKVIEGMSLICYGRFQREERLDWVARSQLLRGPLAVVALCGVYSLTNSLVLAVAGVAMVWAAVYFIHDLPVAWIISSSQGQLQMDPGRLLTLCWTTIPLGLAVGLNTLSANMPRYFVDAHLGPRDLGIFSALAYIGVGARLFYLPLIHTVMPRLAWLRERGEHHAFRKLVVGSVAVALAVSLAVLIGLAICGQLLLELVYTTEYAEHHQLLLILTGATLIHFVAGVVVAGLQALGNFRYVLFCYAAGNVVLVVALPKGIQYAGILGAGVATIAGAVTELFVALMLLNVSARNFSNRPSASAKRGEFPA